MRRAWVGKKGLQARGVSHRFRIGRRLGMGGLASVLALAGLVVFAGEASAHDNHFQSVTAACNAPGAGSGATLTWTLYNDWDQTETGTYSTSQGTLSTTALSIAASPTQNAVPPAAASQTFTQTLTAGELAGASTVSVDWSATWSDGTAVSDTLSTSVAALGLPNGCVQPSTTPTVGTTLSAPGTPSIGNTWGDSATVTGRPGGPAPAGSVDFFICSTPGPACASGGSLVGTVGSPSSSSGNASTYDLGTRFTPTSIGTYCFYTTYTPAGGESYLAASGPPECFSVSPGFPGIVTTLVSPTTPTIGASWSDSALVDGEWGGGTPTGSVTFYACKASDSPTSGATCTDTSNPVGTVHSPTSTSGVTATYTLLPTRYTPPSTGTYCFYTLYRPTNSNYFPVWGPTECFGVYPAGTITTTHTSEDVVTIGGSASDTATVSGDRRHGAPQGTVTFYSCQATTSAGCTGGTQIPGTDSAPNPVTVTANGPTSSTATSPSITPTTAGTYCFGAVFTPSQMKYSGSSDNMSGDVVSDECFTVGPATPSIATTLVTPDSTQVGNVWGDSATVTGVPGGGAPAGSVSFSVCKVAAGSSTCTSGGTLVGTVDSPTSTDGNASTYDLAATYTPANVGSYCFYSVYTPAGSDNYTTAAGPAECFTVTPADPQFGTQQSGSTTGTGSVTLGHSVNDVASVIGNVVGGAPTGSVTFYQCSTGSSPAVCPSGTQVGTPVTLTAGTGATSTATSAAFTPTAVGTYCFAAIYTPDATSNYVGASDNVSGTVSTNECFNVTSVSTSPSSTPSTPASTASSTTSRSPSTTGAIAFTGALLSQEWMIGLAALLLGTGLVVASRWRRRSPRHASSGR